MSYVEATALREGDLIDLEPILAALVPDWDPEHVDIARTEFATVEAVEDAEPVNGVASVVIATDQHNVKMPAELGVWLDLRVEASA